MDMPLLLFKDQGPKLHGKPHKRMPSPLRKYPALRHHYGAGVITGAIVFQATSQEKEQEWEEEEQEESLTRPSDRASPPLPACLPAKYTASIHHPAPNHHNQPVTVPLISQKPSQGGYSSPDKA